MPYLSDIKGVVDRERFSDFAGLRRTVVALAEPVTLQQVKDYCRVSTSDEDTLLTELITVARMWCENYMRRSVMPQTWVLMLDRVPCEKSWQVLPMGEVSSITQVRYKNSDNAWVVLDPTLYSFDQYADPQRFIFGDTPDVSDDEIPVFEITYVAGFADADAVPADIKNAIKAMVSHFYNFRGIAITGTIVQKVPMMVQSILNSYKYWRL
jgi:uncharacterized phiE125 gp8 family phage protein